MNEADAEDPNRSYPLCSLIREDEETMEGDKAMVLQVKNKWPICSVASCSTSIRRRCLNFLDTTDAL